MNLVHCIILCHFSFNLVSILPLRHILAALLYPATCTQISVLKRAMKEELLFWIYCFHQTVKCRTVGNVRRLFVVGRVCICKSINEVRCN